MRYIELEGEKYTLKGRFGTVAKLLRKYDIMKLQKGGWGDDETLYAKFLLESTWRLIEKKGFFKPYLFFWRFKKLVVFDELMAGQKSILGILYGFSEEQEANLGKEDEEKKKSETESKLTFDDFFENIKKHFVSIQYTMVKNFNISLFELKWLDINFVYDMVNLHKREEKSKSFVSMSLAGIDLKNNKDYLDFIRETVKPKEIDMTDMKDVKKMSLELLQGGANG